MTNQQTPEPTHEDLQSFMNKYGAWAESLPPGEQAIAVGLIATAACAGGDVQGFSQRGGSGLDFGRFSSTLGFAQIYDPGTVQRIQESFESFFLAQVQTPDFG